MKKSGLGAYIATRRKQLGLLQRQLADQIGVSDRTYVTQLELGRIELPNKETRIRLAEALHVRESDLLIAAGVLEADENPSGYSVPPGLEELVLIANQLSVRDRGILLGLAKDLRNTHRDAIGLDGPTKVGHAQSRKRAKPAL